MAALHVRARMSVGLWKTAQTLGWPSQKSSNRSSSSSQLIVRKWHKMINYIAATPYRERAAGDRDDDIVVFITAAILAVVLVIVSPFMAQIIVHIHDLNRQQGRHRHRRTTMEATIVILLCIHRYFHSSIINSFMSSAMVQVQWLQWSSLNWADIVIVSDLWLVGETVAYK